MTAELELCDRILDEVGDRAEATVMVRTVSSGLTRFANSVIHQNMAGQQIEVALQTVVDGRSAAATTTQSDAEGVRRLVASTIEVAQVRPPDPDWAGLAPPAPAPAVDHWHDVTANAGPAARASLVQAFIGDDRDTEAAGFCSTEARTVGLANSAGQRLTGRTTEATIDGIHRTRGSDGCASATSQRITELDGAALGAAAAQTARAGVDPAEIAPGLYEVVLAPECVAQLLVFLASEGFGGKSVADGTSFVRVGEAQFDAAVSLRDDRTDPRALAWPFDEDGTPTPRLDLIDGGVSAGVAHDRRTAARAATRSTGHAAFDEFNRSPFPNDLFMEPGKASPSELIAAVRRGLWVRDFWYVGILDPKTQVLTGLTRNGVFSINDGQITGPIANLRFTQSTLGALAPGRVLGVGDDARFAGGTLFGMRCHVPSLHLQSWNFTGGARG